MDQVIVQKQDLQHVLDVLEPELNTLYELMEEEEDLKKPYKDLYKVWSKLHKVLKHSYDEINISWHIDDVKEVAPDLTKAECRKVLQLADHEHDATIGVNWDVLSFWADEVRNNRKS